MMHGILDCSGSTSSLILQHFSNITEILIPNVKSYLEELMCEVVCTQNMCRRNHCKSSWKLENNGATTVTAVAQLTIAK